MDFFAAQARARQQSRLLSWGFALCLIVVVSVLSLMVLAALRIVWAAGENAEPMGDSLSAWVVEHPGVALLTSLFIGGLLGGASLFRMLQLREGGGYVARSVGGVRVERSTQDPRRRMLHNIVDEMALASGVPAPEVYVLEKDDGINAFAAGHSPANAAVAVTRGALQRLNREQLQGVIAHEFSHILNGDIRISIRLMGLVFGLMAVALAGRTLMRLSMVRGNDRKENTLPVLAVGAGIALIGQMGFWGGRILQAWISRQREQLADASAVQFTRNPNGLRDALIRAATMGVNRRFTTAAMEEVAHMLFVPGVERLFATHPPLLERVRALDPHMTQQQIDVMKRQIQADWVRTQIGHEDTLAAQSAPAHSPAAVAVPAAAALIAASAGEPRQHHLDQAVALRQALPENLRGSADAPEQARALMLALVTSSDPQRLDQQLACITRALDSETAAEVRAAQLTTRELPPLLRLPAVLQLFPSLRSLPDGDRLSLARLLGELMRMDGRVSVFKYALEKLVARGLLAQLKPEALHGKASLTEREAALGVIFAVLARHGARNETEARHAYEAGIAPLLPRHRPGYAVLEDWVEIFDQSLDQLCTLHPQAKHLLIEGLVRTIAHDELLTPREAELLRAICAVLECPLPPVLPDLATTNKTI
jgi:Zn-dependent protease with chaperone function